MIPVPLITAAVLTVVSGSLLLMAARKRAAHDVIPRWLWILAATAAGVAGHAGWVFGVEFAAATEESAKSDMFRSAVDAILQPREAAHWLILLLASLGLTSLLLAPLKSDRPTAILFQGLVWACLLAAALTRLLWGSVYLTRQWSTTEAIITISAEALMLTAAIVPGLRRVPAAAAPGQFFLWTVIGVSSSLVIGMSGSAVYSQMAMFTCLIPLTCGLFAWWTRHSQSATHLPAGFIVASLGLHLWLAHYFAELTRLNEFLLIAALVGAGWYGFLSHQSTVNVKVRWLRRLAAASSLLFAVTALVLAGKAFSDAVSANPYY